MKSLPEIFAAHKVVYVSSRQGGKLIKNLQDFGPLCISKVDGNLHFWT